jgi:heme A synthase
LTPPVPAVLFAQQDGDLGGGKIDNFIVDPWVHRLNGSLVVAALLATAVWLTWRALRRQPYDGTAQVLVVTSQVLLMIQALLGIKLLDQGMGVVQLYIHYVGGLLPLGLFLVLGWVRITDPVRRARILAIVVDVSLVAAVMAYLIGQAYVNR